VLVHIPYLINLATPDNVLRKRSMAAYAEDLERTDMLGAEYFVTHLGSHVGSGEEAGIASFTRSLDSVLKKIRPKCTILLENTAGSGNNLGYRFEHIRMIMDGLSWKNVGVCLDTEHAYGAGYDLSSKKGLDKALKDFDDIVGLGKIKAVHYNDSKAKLGSRVDRHEHIGKGNIGKEGMKRIITHTKLRHLPFIMETPKKSPKDDPMNIKTAKGLRR
jgi:deoxyribonuclease-4